MTLPPEGQPSATPATHTFVCYARHDEAFVLNAAAALRERGVSIWIDQWNIEPSANWNRSIDEAIRTCRTFLIFLSPQAVASDEVLGELRAALNARKRIVPVLYRPCEIPTRLLLTQYLDFTQSQDADQTSLDRLARVLLGARQLDAYAPTRDQDRRFQQTLLQDVGAEAGERLRSLGTETPVSILLEPQPHQLARPWDDEVAAPGSRRPAPPITDIGAMFDSPSVGGRLLILGEPGSGKTTLLLQVLQQLAARAIADEGRPIPVLVSLASWKVGAPIGDWLVAELKVKHGVRADHGARWRDDGRIAPLLDGLDELPAESQKACVEAINDFLQEHGPANLVVCCRRAEYENLPVKLRLRGAVCLLPLEPDQIRGYLDRAGRSGIWSAIADDPELLQMARSPLLLSFMIDVPKAADGQGWQDAPSAADRRQRLFDTYVSSHAAPGISRRSYSREQTLRWLQRLAAMLKAHGQSEFLIERMQPEWLGSAAERWFYRAGVLLVSAAVVAFVVVALFSTFDQVPYGRVSGALRDRFPEVYGERSLLDWPVLALLAIVVGAVIALRKTIVPIETLTWSWPRAVRNSLQWGRAGALAGLDYGPTVGVVASLIWFLWTFDAPDNRWRAAGQYVGAAGSLLAAVFLALVKPTIWLRSTKRPAIRWSRALTAGFLATLVFGWTLVWGSGWPEIVPLAVSAFLSSAGVFAILFLSAAANESARELLLRSFGVGLIGGAAVGLICATVVAPTAPLSWFNAWLSGGLVIGLMAGMAISLIHQVPTWLRLNTWSTTPRAPWTWKRIAATGLAIGIPLGLAAVVFSRARGERTIADLTVSSWYLQVGFVNPVVLMMLSAACCAVAGSATAGVLGALVGALGGASGADVERRLVPNQGIRQSAVNVLIFAALGMLIIGVPYGLFNLALGAIWVRLLPSGADWLRLAIAPGFTFGLLAGLVPGAACIQHYLLRFVLWASGTLPLRGIRFLNLATRQRLLQRVGGRYRFIHVLLRDHLGDARLARLPLS